MTRRSPSISPPAGTISASPTSRETGCRSARCCYRIYRSSRYPAVDALGLASERQLVLWFHNQESTWRTEYDHKTPTRLERLRADVPAADGTWTAEWWNTATGEVIGRDTVDAAGGKLVLTVPDFSSDVAARVDCSRPAVPK